MEWYIEGVGLIGIPEVELVYRRGRANRYTGSGVVYRRG